MQIRERGILTLQSFKLHGYHIGDEFVTLDFDLPKGSYATSLLMHLFTLSQGLPVLPGIPQERIDAPTLVGRASIAPTLGRLKNAIFSKAQLFGSDGEEICV